MACVCCYLIVGVHMSMAQGNMKAVLSATMPPNVRGTGFAISALSQGLALGLGNYMAGFFFVICSEVAGHSGEACAGVYLHFRFWLAFTIALVNYHIKKNSSFHFRNRRLAKA